MTVTDAYATLDASDSVTVGIPMACRNDQIYIVGDKWMLYRRWYDVHVYHDDRGQAHAWPDEYRFTSPWSVRIVRCRCGRQYATMGVRVWYCRDCERAKRTAAQRRRRTRARAVPGACAHCGELIGVAARKTRRYCAPGCRQAAYLARLRADLGDTHPEPPDPSDGRR